MKLVWTKLWHVVCYLKIYVTNSKKYPLMGWQLFGFEELISSEESTAILRNKIGNKTKIN